MARFFDKVGYSLPGTLIDGVWKVNIVERDHYGEVLEAVLSTEPGEKVNDDYRLQHRISIVADAFALEHLSTIKYVKHMGARWNVISTRFQRPRLILSLGGVYNGEIPEIETGSDP